MKRLVLAILFLIVACTWAGFLEPVEAACTHRVEYSYPNNGDTNISVNPTIQIRFGYGTYNGGYAPRDVAWPEIENNNNLRFVLRKKNTTANLISKANIMAVIGYFSSGTRVAPTNSTVTPRWEITPSALIPNTDYELVVKRRIDNIDGCDLGTSDFIIAFRTGAAAPPPGNIIDVAPTNGETNVVLNLPEATVKFDQQVDDTVGGANSVLNSSNFYITPAVSGSTLYYDSTQALAKIQFGAALAASTTYTVTVTNVKDVNGNLVNGQPYTWTFTTKSSDTTRPTAVITSPTTTVSIPTNQSFTIQFSEAMDPATITTSNIYINGVTSTVSYDALNFIATLTPTTALNYATDYTLTVSTGVTDASANSLLQPLSFAFTTAQNLTPAPMNDYCQIPPFIAGASVKPNVLLLVDNSGSMNEFAYKAKGYGDSNYDTSYDSTKTYYGYFDNTKMYTYISANGHYAVDLSATTLDTTSIWSGNFLNWLTMRRVDVVRKVLVGGKITPRAVNNANYVEGHDRPDRDYYKRYGTNYFVIDNGKVYSCGNNSNCSTNNATSTYNIKIYVGNNPPEEGLIIKMQDQINFGIVFFNPGYRFEDGANNVRDGGYVSVDLGATGTNLITQVENTDPSTWTPLAEAFYEAVHYFMAITGPYNNTNYAAKDPITHSCQKNFILILTDGESTKDRNLPGGYWGSPMTDSNGFNIKTWMDNIKANEGGTYVSQWNVSPNTSGGSYYLEGVAYWAHVTDLRSATLGKSNISGKQNITTYAVYAFDDSNLGRDLLQKTCKYGGFEDTNGTGKPDQQAKWDKNLDGIPDTYYEAQDGSKLEGQLKNALLDILTRVSSGTAASILNNSEGSGASLLQAVFYPRKAFDNGTEVSWIGEMQNLWYYLDPYLQLSTIRVDTVNDYKLNLLNDYLAQFYFDSNSNQTLVRLMRDVNGDGKTLVDLGAYNPDDTANVKSLWRAGRLLWARNLSTDNRTIYTRTGNVTFDTTNGLASFGAGLKNDTTIQSYLQAANATEAEKIINYIRGVDQTGYRSRAAIIAGANGTWRLGDIVSSTPKIQGNVGLNTYHQKAPIGYSDSSYDKFIESNDYKNRGMAYVGANDGMLHAFRMGVLKELTDPCRTLESDSTSSTCIADKAKINDYTTVASGVNAGANANTRADAADLLGREEWAFVPRQTLPYLKYFADPNYSHLFYVDGTPLIVDVAINRPDSYDAVAYPSCATSYWACPKQTMYDTHTKNLDLAKTSWRTILIGSTGLGGASRNRGGAGKCAGGGSDCVKTPVADLGYSSYFALDITNPTQPKFLWEFYGDPAAGIDADAKGGNLGFATTGPVIIRVGDKDKNGRWFAVFASGPTGPIETSTHQFLGRSDQNLKLFVVDIATGTLVKTIDSGITNAFAGSVSNSAIDNDRSYPSNPGFYQDDAAYIGYVQKVDATNWTNGGVLRLVTNESIDPNDGTKPWSVSKVIDNVGPVTTAIAKLQDRANGKLWLYFGAGRFYFKNATTVDDGSSQRYLYGIQEPCYSSATQKIDASCTSTIATSALNDQTTSPSPTLAATDKGWFVALDDDSLNDGYASERVITDPVAATNGAVYFTTFRPTSDVCGYGGNSFVWKLHYATGAASTPPPTTPPPKLLVQVSTGAFAEVTAFSDKESRRSAAIQGVPPKAQGLSLLTNPRPIKKILHIQEK